MSIKITETDRDTLLVNGKELAKVGDNWQLVIPGDPLTTQEQIALLNYLNGGEAKPVSWTAAIVEQIVKTRDRRVKLFGPELDSAEYVARVLEQISAACLHPGDLKNAAIEIAALSLQKGEDLERNIP